MFQGQPSLGSEEVHPPSEEEISLIPKFALFSAEQGSSLLEPVAGSFLSSALNFP